MIELPGLLPRLAHAVRVERSLVCGEDGRFGAGAIIAKSGGAAYVVGEFFACGSAAHFQILEHIVARYAAPLWLSIGGGMSTGLSVRGGALRPARGAGADPGVLPGRCRIVHGPRLLREVFQAGRSTAT